MALFLPVHPAGRAPASITLTPRNEPAISAVRSLDPSSTTITSNCTPGCATSDCRQFPRQVSSLRAGTMTETAGCNRSGGGDDITRIVYYSGVVRASLLSIVLTALLCGCYSDSRPPHIGAPAPDFTVQDDQRSITLSQLRGKTVFLNFWATWCAPCVEEM